MDKSVMNLGGAVPWAGVQSLGGQVLDWWAEPIVWRAQRDIHRMSILFFHLINM